MVRIVSLRFCAVAICLAAVPSYADISLSLQQGQSGYTGCSDTYMDVAHYATNYGNEWDVFTEDESGARDFVVRFNLTSVLPSGANVRSASLNVYYYDDYGIVGDDYLKLGAYRLKVGWDEGIGGSGEDRTGASWHYRYAYPANTTWDEDGAQGDADRYATHDAEVTVYDSDEDYGWKTWSGTAVTNTVKAWHASPSQNFGWVVDVNYSNDTSNRADFHSSEYGTNPADYVWRPRLDITYTLAPVAKADGPYRVTPTESDLLSGAGSYDPDGENIVSWLWDLDNDGAYDDASGSTYEVTYDFLVNGLGLLPGQVHPIGLKVIDDEGEWGTAASSIDLVPEPGVLVLLGIGGVLFLARRRAAR